MSKCLHTTKPAGYTLGQVVRQFGQSYIDLYEPPYRIIKILKNIANCRTSALGGHLVECSECDYQKSICNSCGDGNCPQCQNIKKELWIDKMKHHFLPVKHYHLIFTIPHELNDLFFYNQKQCYQLLFSSAWESIKTIAGQGSTGMVATLHSWGSNLSCHPHLHCIVPGGKLLENAWLPISSASQRCLCDATQLRETFKEIFIRRFVTLLEDALLYVGNIDEDERDDYQQKLLKTINRKKWNVRIESPILGVEQIIEYLGRYIRRVALSNNRIQEITDHQVTLEYKQYSKQKKGEPAPSANIKFGGVAFIQRFTQHILPPYFHRVRYYGIYAFAAKAKKEQAYELIEGQPQNDYKKPLKRQLLKKMLGIDPDVCPQCGCYQTLHSQPLERGPKFYFRLNTYWHNAHIKLRQARPDDIAA